MLEQLGSQADINNDIGQDDWICEACSSSLVYPNKIRKKCHQYAEAREGALDHTIKILVDDGACLASSIIDMYKGLIHKKYPSHDVANSEFLSYKNILKMNIEAKGYNSYCPSKKNW